MRYFRALTRVMLSGLIFGAQTVQAQKLHRIKGYCGLFYSTMDDLYRQKEAELAFYQFKPGQVVASIGAQCGHWEASYAITAENVHFYLEDIDTTYFNERQVGFAWHYYDSISGYKMTSRYTLVTGNEHSTLLPPEAFDKIFIINSFHEFSAKDEMLADLKTKLKKGGILYIDETVPFKQGQLHGVCRMPMLTGEEMTGLLARNGYRYTGGKDIQFRKNKVSRRIYAFVRATP